jgi:hypothetical protein
LRRLIVTCAAAVKDQQHEPAADDEGEEDAEAHLGHYLVPVAGIASAMLPQLGRFCAETSR